VLIGEIVDPEAPPPELKRFRRFWLYPFLILLALTLLSGLGLWALFQASAGAASLGLFCLTGLFVLAAGLTLLAFATRTMPWLHVRVREKEGRRVFISLPLPSRLVQAVLALARGVTSPAQRRHMEMAEEFVTAADAGSRQRGDQPLYINVDDEDGDQVEIYLG
jgi:hypothetical protein